MGKHYLEVNCSGMAQGTPPEPCMVVILGVAGDLGRTTLIPSLYALGAQGLLPEPVGIIGVARRDWDDATLRQEMRPYVEDTKRFREDQWNLFARHLHYAKVDFSASPEADYAVLRDLITRWQDDYHMPDNVLFHLSTPPSFYEEIIQKLAAASLLDSDNGWRRVIIEKPFGHDAISAQQLDRELLKVIDEEQLYRVDHYLGKETVQNMLVFRFANPGFEPIWNAHYIDHVQITAAEDTGIGTRAGYYDGMGVVRDMVQNHLLQLLCMTAMEAPVSYDSLSLRNETFKVLQAIQPVDVQQDCVLGQYGAGENEDYGSMCAYRDEANVPRDSITPTFAAFKLRLHNWRWTGVPFYLRTGKRLSQKLTEITIHFKPMPHLMFAPRDGESLHHNILTFRLQPDEGIVHTFLGKQPGPDICLTPVTMNFRYDLTFGIDELPSAYEWLLHDAMHGDQTLFPRSDWIYKAWSLVDPIMQHWEAHAALDLPNYAAGSRGPAPADALLERDRRTWHGM